MKVKRNAFKPSVRLLEERINLSGAILTVKTAQDYDPNRNLQLQFTAPIANSLRAHLKTAMEHNINSSGADVDTIVFNTDPSQGDDFSDPNTVINLRGSLGGTYEVNAPFQDTYLPINRSVVIRGPRVSENDPTLPLIKINWVAGVGTFYFFSSVPTSSAGSAWKHNRPDTRHRAIPIDVVTTIDRRPARRGESSRYQKEQRHARSHGVTSPNSLVAYFLPKNRRMKPESFSD